MYRTALEGCHAKSQGCDDAKGEEEQGGRWRSAGGRPRKLPAEPSPEEPPSEAPDVVAGESSAPTVAEPPDPEPDPAPVEVPPPAPEPQAWEPTPTALPPRYCSTPLSSDSVPSRIVRPRCLSRTQVEQRVELKRKYHDDNGICNCQNDGLPSSGRDEDHSMFCQFYKCYAYEAMRSAAARGVCMCPSQRTTPP